MVDKPIILARVGKVSGIKGWLKLVSFTSPAENITNYKQFSISSTQVLEMDGIKKQSKGWVAHFVGYDTPEDARQLTGKELAVAKDALPELAAEDYYWHQLQGLRVFNKEEQYLGVVDHLLDTGANDVLVVRPQQDETENNNSIDDRERLIPYLLHSTVTRVDLDDGLIEVDWQADYLE